MTDDAFDCIMLTARSQCINQNMLCAQKEKEVSVAYTSEGRGGQCVLSLPRRNVPGSGL